MNCEIIILTRRNHEKVFFFFIVKCLVRALLKYVLIYIKKSASLIGLKRMHFSCNTSVNYK